MSTLSGGPRLPSNLSDFIDLAGIIGRKQKYTLTHFYSMLNGRNTTYGSNLIPKIYALYPYCPIDDTTANATAYSYNLIDPTQFQVTWTGFVPADYSISGVTGGSGKYGDTNLNILNNIGTLAHGLDVYIRTQSTRSEGEMGAFKGSPPYDGGNIYPYSPGGDNHFINTFIAYTTLQSVRTSLQSVDYDGTNVRKYRNGVSYAVQAQSIGTPQSLTYILHARRFGASIQDYSIKSNAGFSIRQPFTTNEMVDFNEAWQWYQTNIIIGGRNV